MLIEGGSLYTLHTSLFISFCCPIFKYSNHSNVLTLWFWLQHLLENGKPHERSATINQLISKTVQMSQQKFSSIVILKCLSFGTPEERQRVVNEILGSRDEHEPLQVRNLTNWRAHWYLSTLEISNWMSLYLKYFFVVLYFGTNLKFFSLVIKVTMLPGFENLLSFLSALIYCLKSGNAWKQVCALRFTKSAGDLRWPETSTYSWPSKSSFKCSQKTYLWNP